MNTIRIDVEASYYETRKAIKKAMEGRFLIVEESPNHFLIRDTKNQVETRFDASTLSRGDAQTHLAAICRDAAYPYSKLSLLPTAKLDELAHLEAMDY